MPLADNALLTEAEVRDALKMTAATLPDAEAQTLANAVSDRFEAETGRRLKSRTYTDQWTLVRTVIDDEHGQAWRDVQAPITALTLIEIDGVVQTLWMPGDAGRPDDREVWVLPGDDPKKAQDRLYRKVGWALGQLVKRTYTAGYGVGAFLIPEDLKEAARATVRHFHLARDRQATNVASRSSGMETIIYANLPLPIDALPVLGLYRRDHRRWVA